MAEPGREPGTANDVLALCTGTMMRKGTCGTLTLNGFGVWVWQLLCLLENKHRNDHMLAFHLRERNKERPEVTCKGSKPNTLPLRALDGPRHLGQGLAPPQLSCWHVMWVMLNVQPGLQPFLEGHRCHKLQEGLKSEFRATCLCAGSSPESAGLQAAPTTCQLRYSADLACSSAHYNLGRCKLRFPVCTGSVIVSAMTKSLFSCTTIPFVHRSEHCSHKKSVFLSAVAMGSSHAGSRFTNKQKVWLMSISSGFPHHTHLNLLTF